MPAPTSLYPLTLPNHDFKDVMWRKKPSTAITRSPYTGQTFVMPNEFDEFTGTVRLPPMSIPQAQEWIAFFALLEGVRGTFYMEVPDNLNLLSNNATTRVSTSARAYDLSVSVPSGTTGTLRPGQYVQVGVGAASHLHILTASTHTANATNFVITLSPSLKIDVPSGSPVRLIKPRGVFRLISNTTQHNADYLSLHGISFAFQTAQ